MLLCDWKSELGRPMDRDTFLDHLAKASEICREFATHFVVDSLPHASRFFVALNCSYDKIALKDGEVAFPDDVQKYGKRIGPLEKDEVVSLLWRDRMVPEWINISVCDADEQFSYVELKCCGRFTSREKFLYYTSTGVAPFGVKSPRFPERLATLPLNVKQIPKFSLAELRQTTSPRPGE
jgi:hypothetical protein